MFCSKQSFCILFAVQIIIFGSFQNHGAQRRNLRARMASDGEGNPKGSINVSIGKQTDAALGDVIRGLLKRPSETIGDLVADGIGLLGDRVKHKRELNAKLALEEARRRLDADGVDMKDITPPKEEELYLLINGMSLAADTNVRNLLAGFFAKALQQTSDTGAERPYISILASLSPMDAKIIDLLAFILRTDAEFKSRIKNFTTKDPRNPIQEEKDYISKINSENLELRNKEILDIQNKAIEYGLFEEVPANWADNLIRQGIIQRNHI
jgi:hypothetical protein